MILFKPEHKDLILKGLKTQTRRTGKCRWRVGSIHQAKLNFKKGSTPFAHLKITGVRQEPFGAITEEDAKKEGYSSVDDYIEAFFRIYSKQLKGKKLVDIGEMPVWVIDFKVVEP